MSEYYEMEEDEFPNCCGIRVVSEFPNLADAEDKEDRDDMIEAFAELANSYENKMVLVALTDQQLKSGWLSEVRRHGYRLLKRFRNGPSGNHISLYGRVGANAVASYPYEGKPKNKKR